LALRGRGIRFSQLRQETKKKKTKRGEERGDPRTAAEGKE